MIFYTRTIPVFIHYRHYYNGCQRTLVQSCRSFSSLDASPSSAMRNAEVQTIHTEALNISKQGRLEIRCPFNLHVTPLHQKDFPRLDKAFFTIYGKILFKCEYVQCQREHRS
jgi:hypothetical protein